VQVVTGAHVADVALVRRVGGEVAVEQVGHFLVGRLGHGGADAAAQAVDLGIHCGMWLLIDPHAYAVRERSVDL
jgi:hypothetical protein